ncbi:hypothetical protein ACWD33_05630 [Streptomyces xiamenensis]
MTRPSLHRAAGLAAIVVSGAWAGWLGFQLHGYDVPLPLMFASAFAAWSVLGNGLLWLIGELATVTHRCATKGCDFAVKLTQPTAADSRYWQEIAADHPHRKVGRS